VKAVHVTTAVDTTVIGILAAIWLTAGVLADALPDVRTARALHRRARALSILVGVGSAALVAVPVVAAFLPGMSSAPSAALLPAVPALVVVGVTLRRLTWLRRGAAAFSAAPLTPAPPALRAAAAHPLLATPLQVTGLAAAVGVPIAAGLIAVPGASVAGMAITLIALGVVAIAVRHAIRHSRLAEHAVRIRAAFLG
jgi:MFS family permease